MPRKFTESQLSSIKKVLSSKFPKLIKYTKNRRPKSGSAWYSDNILVKMKKHRSRRTKDVENVFINEFKRDNKVPPFSQYTWEIHALERLFERNITKLQAYECIKKGIRTDQSSFPTKRTKYIYNEIEVLVDVTNPKKPIVITEFINSRFGDVGFIDLLPRLTQELYDANSGFVITNCAQYSDMQNDISKDISFHIEKDRMVCLMRKSFHDHITDREIHELNILRYKFLNRNYGEWELYVDGKNDKQLIVPETWVPEKTKTYSLNFMILSDAASIVQGCLDIFSEYGVGVDNSRCKPIPVNPGKFLGIVQHKMSPPHHWAISQKLCKNNKIAV